jgi:aspartyl protease family protein
MMNNRNFIYSAITLISTIVLSSVIMYLLEIPILKKTTDTTKVTSEDTQGHLENNTINNESQSKVEESIFENSNSNTREKIIPIKKNGGVYYISVEINGISLDFILDTGASVISISDAEAIVLFKQGTLDDTDILGTEIYEMADGSKIEATIINLRSVKIGEFELTNVEAIVIDNLNAPLLLGQSILEQFGEISIDYKNNTITLKI